MGVLVGVRVGLGVGVKVRVGVTVAVGRGSFLKVQVTLAQACTVMVTELTPVEKLPPPEQPMLVTIQPGGTISAIV